MSFVSIFALLRVSSSSLLLLLGKDCESIFSRRLSFRSIFHRRIQREIRLWHNEIDLEIRKFTIVKFSVGQYVKAKREPRTSIIIHLLNTLKNIWRNSLIGNLDSIIIDNRVNWGGKKIIRTMIWMVMKFGWNRWSRLGWWREVERKERVSTGGKRGKVRGVKLDAVEARGGQVGVPICDSTQQEGRGGPAHRVARSFARHCRATLTFCPSAPPSHLSLLAREPRSPR